MLTNNSQIAQQVFSDNSKKEGVGLYAFLLIEETEDVSNSQVKKYTSEKSIFLSTSFKARHFKSLFCKCNWSKIHLPSLDFISLRVLRL